MMMRVLLVAVIALSLPGADLLAQYNPYLVFFPSHVSTGEYAGDYDICAAKFFVDGSLDWSADAPRPVCSQPFREYTPQLLPDGSGGFYLVYAIDPGDTANADDRDIFVRRIGPNYTNVWGDSTGNNAIPVARSRHTEQNPQVVRLADSSLIVFYEVRYTAGKFAGDLDVAAVRIGPDGEMLWGGAVWIANSTHRERLAGAVSDGENGAIAVLEIESVEGDLATNRDLYVTRITAEKEQKWPDVASKLIAVGASKHFEQNASVESDGAGGLYLAYEVQYVTGARSGDRDILAQHISRTGERLWVDEAAPAVVSSNARAIESMPDISVDDAGIVVAFQITIRYTEEPVQVIGVQRMSRDGKAMWNNGVRAHLFATESRIPEAPVVVSGPSGGTYLLMEARDTVTTDYDVFAEYLDVYGNQQWGKGQFAIPVFNSPYVERNPVAMSDSLGGLIVVAVQQGLVNSESTDSSIVAQRIGKGGALMWHGPKPYLVLGKSKLLDTRPVLVQAQ